MTDSVKNLYQVFSVCVAEKLSEEERSFIAKDILNGKTLQRLLITWLLTSTSLTFELLIARCHLWSIFLSN